jgi:hypothetical protein
MQVTNDGVPYAPVCISIIPPELFGIHSLR